MRNCSKYYSGLAYGSITLRSATDEYDNYCDFLFFGMRDSRQCIDTDFNMKERVKVSTPQSNPSMVFAQTIWQDVTLKQWLPWGSVIGEPEPVTLTVRSLWILSNIPNNRGLIPSSIATNGCYPIASRDL